MPKLLVIYDPTGVLDLRIPPTVPEDERPAIATIDVVKGADIETVARKLATLLLEQMR